MSKEGTQRYTEFAQRATEKNQKTSFSLWLSVTPPCSLCNRISLEWRRL